MPVLESLGRWVLLFYYFMLSYNKNNRERNIIVKMFNSVDVFLRVDLSDIKLISLNLNRIVYFY